MAAYHRAPTQCFVMVEPKLRTILTHALCWQLNSAASQGASGAISKSLGEAESQFKNFELFGI